MKRLVMVVLLLAGYAAHGWALSGDMQEITVQTEFGDYGASFFPGSGRQAVVCIPGTVRDRESWYFLTQALQEKGIASLAFDEISGPAILGGISLLKQRGYEEIGLVGASRGAAVALTLPVHPLLDEGGLPGLTKMVLLAPFGGDGCQREDVAKLFIVGAWDGLAYPNTMRVFDDSSYPKTMHDVEDAAYHAQQLFDTEHKDALTRLIVSFLTE